MWSQKLMWALWPAFLSACVLELLVFAMVDPNDLRLAGHALDWSRQGIYTAAFFVFWLVGLACGVLTTLLAMTPAQVNGCPVPPCERPDSCR